MCIEDCAVRASGGRWERARSARGAGRRSFYFNLQVTRCKCVSCAGGCGNIGPNANGASSVPGPRARIAADLGEDSALRFIPPKPFLARKTTHTKVRLPFCNPRSTARASGSRGMAINLKAEIAELGSQRASATTRAGRVPDQPQPACILPLRTDGETPTGRLGVDASDTWPDHPASAGHAVAVPGLWATMAYG